MDNNNRDKRHGAGGNRSNAPKTDRGFEKRGNSGAQRGGKWESKPRFDRDSRTDARKTDRNPNFGQKKDFGRKPAGDGEKRPFNGEKRPYGGDKKPFNGEKRAFDGEKRPYNGDRSRGPRPANGRRSTPKQQPQLRSGTARDAALCALTNVIQNGAYASIALDRQLSERNLSPEDRRLATSIFYLAAENRLRIEYALNKFLNTQPEPTVWDILHIAAAQILFMDRIPDRAAVDEAVKQVRAAGREGLTGMVNGVLRNLVRAKEAGETLLPERDEDPIRYISIVHSLSEHIVRRLVEAYGLEEAESIAAFRPTERVQTLRPNRMLTTPEEFGAYLTANGVKWEKGVVEDAFLCSGGGDLTALEGYRKGMFSIQGESSMLAALAVEAKPGMAVLDACAAPGGKSAVIAEAMNGAGRVYAWDVHEHRVELLRAMSSRLRLYNLRPSVHDARRALESLELTLDAVLVDAPCSGLGVIADKPDIKYRLTEANLNELVPLQKDILAACATHVKVGGLLVYSTCTILPEENEKQVRAFLAEHPEFEPDTDASYLPEKYRPLVKDGMLQLLQHRDGLEGFFIARMRRKRV